MCMMVSTRFERIVGSDLRTVEGRKRAAFAKISALSVDEAVRAHTAMATLAEIVACTVRDGYRPSLYTTPRGTSVYRFELAFLAQKIADAFDAEMVRLGRKERAYRGH